MMVQRVPQGSASRCLVAVIGSYPDVGKGNFSAALAYLAKTHGLTAGIAKFDGYFNLSAGNMSPYHSRPEFLYSNEECFVLTDGNVTDCDHGYYERFLDEELTSESYLTNGHILDSLISRIRSHEFPSGEILKYKHFRDALAGKLRALIAPRDVLVFEVGGTVGDDELHQLFKVLRDLKHAPDIAVKVVMMSPYFSVDTGNGELSYRTKLARKAFLELVDIGLRPDVIVLRNNGPIYENDLHYIASDCGLQLDRVISDPQLDNIYQLPAVLAKQGLLAALFPERDLGNRSGRLEAYCAAFARARQPLSIGVLGKCGANWVDGHLSLKEAIEHAAIEAGRVANIRWLDDDLEAGVKTDVKDIAGLVASDGTLFRDRKVELIREFRRTRKPILAISFGADLLLKEIAATALGSDVSLEEFEPARELNIAKAAPFVGAQPTRFDTKSWMHAALGKAPCPERYRHHSWPTKKLLTRLGKHVKVVGWTESGEAAAFTAGDQTIGVKFFPQYRSRPGKPHPLFRWFVSGCLERR